MAEAADKGVPTMRVRFRRGGKIGARNFEAGDVENVPVSDDAWHAINRGECDLQPGPGIGEQPKAEDIPEWVKSNEASETPPPAAPKAAGTGPRATPAPAPAARPGKDH